MSDCVGSNLVVFGPICVSEGEDSTDVTFTTLFRSQNQKVSHDKQRKKSRTGLVKVSSISNNRVSQSDPRLAWLVFHKISEMYIDIREQESKEATELILNLFANLNSNNTSLLSPITSKISIQQPTMNLDPEKVTKDPREIQPRPSQVWNCDEIGFDPNVSWPYSIRLTCLITERVYLDDDLGVIYFVDFHVLTAFMKKLSSDPKVLTSMGNP